MLTLFAQLQLDVGQQTPSWLKSWGADAIPKELCAQCAHPPNWARQGRRDRPGNNQKDNHSTPSCCAKRTWFNICRKPSSTACYLCRSGDIKPLCKGRALTKACVLALCQSFYEDVLTLQIGKIKCYPICTLCGKNDFFLLHSMRLPD